MFVVYSLAAAYSHYYALIAVALFYILLLLNAIIYDKKQLKAVIVACIAAVVGYLPWFIVLLQTFMRVSDNYWIAPITFNSLLRYGKAIFSYVFVMILSIVFLAVFVVGMLMKKINCKDSKTAIAAMSVSIWVIAVGIVVSLAVRPVFVSRYIMPTVLCFWFGLSLAVYKTDKRLLTVCFTVMVLVSSVLQMNQFVKYEMSHIQDGIKTAEFIEKIKAEEDVIIISSDDHVAFSMKSATEHYCQILNLDSNDENKDEKKTDNKIQAENDIIEALNEGKKVYYARLSKRKDQGFITPNLQFDYLDTYRFGEDSRISDFYSVHQSNHE